MMRSRDAALPALPVDPLDATPLPTSALPPVPDSMHERSKQAEPTPSPQPTMPGPSEDPPRHWFQHFTEATATAIRTLTDNTLAANAPMPEERVHASQLLSQLSFDIRSPRAQGAVVVIDGRDLGRAGTYAEGVATLDIVPGSHHLLLDADGIIILDERFDIAHGAQQTFIAR